MMGRVAQRGDRDGSKSICTKPEHHPIRYHWHSEVPGERVIDAVRKLVASIVMPPLDRDRLVGEMLGRLRALKRGELVPRLHIAGPMETATNLELFEVRGGVDFSLKSTAQIRVYHVEPRSLRRAGGSTVIGLHCHHKVTDAGANINDLQDAEIQKACQRFADGRPTWWGGARLPLPG